MKLLIIANLRFYRNCGRKNLSIDNNDAEYEQLDALVASISDKCIDKEGYVTNVRLPEAHEEVVLTLDIDVNRANEIVNAVYARIIGSVSVAKMWVRIMSALTDHPWWYCRGVDTATNKTVDIFWDESLMSHEDAVKKAISVYPTIA